MKQYILDSWDFIKDPMHLSSVLSSVEYKPETGMDGAGFFPVVEARVKISGAGRG